MQGNIAVMTRADDVINVAGHRLSSGQLEEVYPYRQIEERGQLSIGKGQIPKVDRGLVAMDGKVLRFL